MRAIQRLIPPAVGLALASALVLGAGCSPTPDFGPPSAADKEEQTLLQERIRKGLEKRPGEKAASKKAKRAR